MGYALPSTTQPSRADQGLSLARIALRREAEALVLDDLGLDFWLKGARTLAEACDEAGHDVEGVEQRLAEASQAAGTPATDWWSAPLDAVISRVVDGHHAYTRAALERLRGLAVRVIARHQASHPELVVVEHVLGALHDDLLPHLLREERILFPFIREVEKRGGGPLVGGDSAAHPVRTMLAQHATTADLLEELVATTDGFVLPPTACNDYANLYQGLAALRRDLLLHLTLEESVLFPRALALAPSLTPLSPV